MSPAGSVHAAIAAVVFLTVSFSASALGQDRSGTGDRGNQTNPSDIYLGQRPLGLAPKLFAPGIVSTGPREHSVVLITPDGIGSD